MLRVHPDARRFSGLTGLAVLLTLGCLPLAPGYGDESDGLSVEQQAALLQRVTVTVRVTLSDDEAGAIAGATSDGGDESGEVSRASRVSVCSGISLGNGLIVSSVYVGSDSRIRITLPGGGQATARLSVIDGYSGLVLLRVDRTDLPGIPLAVESPPIGRRIVMAAAWGAQDPVVSLGIVSGVERTLSGVSFPPLLQCDLRTAETASGAGIVDRTGQLLGIVVLADQPDRLRGWTYAVPASHVQRLLRAEEQRREAAGNTRPEGTGNTRPEGNGDARGSEDMGDARGSEDMGDAGGAGGAARAANTSVIVLKRRRPVVGMVLGGDEQGITVRRVEADSPADRAGIQVGDRILAADGVQIRSVYQAVRPVLFKQPGDVMQYLVEQPAGVRRIDVKLGGGVELPSATLENLGQYVRPKIDIEGLAAGRFRASSARGEVREVYAGEPDAVDAETDPGLVTNAQKLQMLERALDSYRNVIEYQRQELGRREKERRDLEQQVQALQQQLRELRGQD